jgi:release factor glutamine methyltransferase
VKRIKKVRDFLTSYYQKHKDSLQKDYPGLPLARFIDEYCEFDGTNADDEFFMENPAFFEKIKIGFPLEYINFKAFFYRDEFYVNPSVLIPRSETEILVEMAAQSIIQNYHDNFTLYDIGTGSGAIALSVALEIKKPLKIIASDISKEALEVAMINYDHLKEKLHPKTQVHFDRRDRLSDYQGDLLDLVVANPPYIKLQADQAGVHSQVHTYEPHLALYLKDQDYDEWFNTLFKQVSEHLKEGGRFIMEGHEDHLVSLQKLGHNFFKRVELVNDYTHRPRFITMSK